MSTVSNRNDRWPEINCILTTESESTEQILDLNYVIYCIKILSNKRSLTWNQSIVQQLTREGNFLSLFLKASPIGLIAKTI